MIYVCIYVCFVHGGLDAIIAGYPTNFRKNFNKSKDILLDKQMKINTMEAIAIAIWSK